MIRVQKNLFNYSACDRDKSQAPGGGVKTQLDFCIDNSGNWVVIKHTPVFRMQLDNMPGKHLPRAGNLHG